MDLEDIILPLPQRLKVERRRLKLTQEQFGKLGGVTQTSQCLFEKGIHWPSLHYLELLRINNIDVAFIATGTRFYSE